MDRIEVTPAMEDAGWQHARLWEPGDSLLDLVMSAYVAMEEVRRQELTAGGFPRKPSPETPHE